MLADATTGLADTARANRRAPLFVSGSLDAFVTLSSASSLDHAAGQKGHCLQGNIWIVGPCMDHH